MKHRIWFLAAALWGLPGISIGSASAPAAEVARLQSAADASPKDGSAQYALALALQKEGRQRDAIAAFDRSIVLGYQVGGAQLRAAQSESALGQRDAALKRVQLVADTQAFALNPILKLIGGVPGLDNDERFKQILNAVDAKRYPCRTRAESRQLDFWQGEWNVTSPTAQPLGTSSITRDLEGCVIREAWAGSLGGKGTSVNFYDPAGKQWHQVWTDDNGSVTMYVGEFRDGAMRFHSEDAADAKGVIMRHTLTFTPNADGSVRQLFQNSTDGKEWTTTFDGHYVRNGG